MAAKSYMETLGDFPRCFFCSYNVYVQEFQISECNLVFHERCIKEWFKNKKLPLKCPKCFVELEKKDYLKLSYGCQWCGKVAVDFCEFCLQCVVNLTYLSQILNYVDTKSRYAFTTKHLRYFVPSDWKNAEKEFRNTFQMFLSRYADTVINIVRYLEDFVFDPTFHFKILNMLLYCITLRNQLFSAEKDKEKIARASLEMDWFLKEMDPFLGNITKCDEEKEMYRETVNNYADILSALFFSKFSRLETIQKITGDAFRIRRDLETIENTILRRALLNFVKNQFSKHKLYLTPFNFHERLLVVNLRHLKETDEIRHVETLKNCLSKSEVLLKALRD